MSVIGKPINAWIEASDQIKPQHIYTLTSPPTHPDLTPTASAQNRH